MTNPASPIPPIKKTRASRVSEAFRLAIVQGELEPGSKINLDQLRTKYGVSLSPLREAVSRLVADGLVLFEDQRGYRVAPVSGENLDEITRLRADLEALALGHAIDRAGLDWESDVLASLHRLAHGEADPAAHRNFHQALVRGCAMPQLIAFCTMLRDLHDRYRNILDPDETASGSAAEHQAIAVAAVARDADLAPTLLRRHIERTGLHLSGLLKSDLPSDSKGPQPCAT